MVRKIFNILILNTATPGMFIAPVFGLKIIALPFTIITHSAICALYTFYLNVFKYPTFEFTKFLYETCKIFKEP